jgi:integrase
MKIDFNKNSLERYDAKRKQRTREKTRLRVRKHRALVKQNRELPAGVIALAMHPGAKGETRGGTSRSAQHATRNALPNAIKRFVDDNPGADLATNIIAADGSVLPDRVNHGEYTYVLFKDENGKYLLVRFLKAVKVSSGDEALRQFESLHRDQIPRSLKTFDTYIKDAIDVWKADLNDRRAVLEGKIAHRNDFGFWLVIGALSWHKVASIDVASRNPGLKSQLNVLILRSGNPLLAEDKFSEQSISIMNGIIEGYEGNKLRRFKLQVWALKKYLLRFSKAFIDKIEFSWVNNGNFDDVIDGDAKVADMLVEIDHRKAYSLLELKALITSAVKNGDNYRSSTSDEGFVADRSISRSLAAAIAMRATLGVRPSELNRLQADHFQDLVVKSRNNVTKTAEAKSVPHARASILARILRRETFMSQKHIANEFTLLKSGRICSFYGAFANPMKDAKHLVAYGLRSTMVTNLLYLSYAATKFRGKFVYLTTDEITHRTSHASTEMIKKIYGQLSETLQTLPDPRRYYGFDGKAQGRFVLVREGISFDISELDTLYECWLLKVWLDAWRAVDPEKSRYYCDLAIEEYQLEKKYLSEDEFSDMPVGFEY